MEHPRLPGLEGPVRDHVVAPAPDRPVRVVVDLPVLPPAQSGNGLEMSRVGGVSTEEPLRRFGTVEEVAQAVIYLASDESRYTTGIELVLDGGLLAGSAATPNQ